MKTEGPYYVEFFDIDKSYKLYFTENENLHPFWLLSLTEGDNHFSEHVEHIVKVLNQDYKKRMELKLPATNLSANISAMSGTPSTHELVGWIVRHFKGHIYKVESVAKDSETLEELVVYRSTDISRQVWVRPLKMFLEEVEVNGEKVPRFQKLHQEATLSQR